MIRIGTTYYSIAWYHIKNHKLYCGHLFIKDAPEWEFIHYEDYIN